MNEKINDSITSIDELSDLLIIFLEELDRYNHEAKPRFEDDTEPTLRVFSKWLQDRIRQVNYCENCDGRGDVNIGAKECQKCNGTGLEGGTN